MTLDFIILGGGCFGSFYVRQLLRGAQRLGIGSLHVIDHDPRCKARVEFGDHPRIVYHVQDWREFLVPYFDACLEKASLGEVVADHYIPPTFAPHVLMELFCERAKKEFPQVSIEKKKFETQLGTPVDMLLPAGTRAMSFATWTCPASCIEPPMCPHTRGPKDWDMKRHLMDKLGNVRIFQCRHFAMGVGTIPMREILEEYLRFRDTIGQPGYYDVSMASVSSCHGLIGKMEIRHASS